MEVVIYNSQSDVLFVKYYSQKVRTEDRIYNFPDHTDGRGQSRDLVINQSLLVNISLPTNQDRVSCLCCITNNFMA